MAKAMDHATTGMRINSAQEGAANYAISERMRERINSLGQAQQNVQNDTSMLKTAEGAISNTVDILRSSRALVLQGMDASTNDNDRLAIAKQLTKNFDQIDYNATNTTYNGKLLLAQPATGKEDTEAAIATADANTKTITLQFQIGDSSGAVISDVSLQNMTLAGLGIFKVDTGGYNSLTALTSAELAGKFFRESSDNAGGTGAGKTLLASLEGALKTALNAATDIGAYEQRLGYQADNLTTQIENLEASDSAIRDSDMAKEISNYMKWNVLSQASQYMLAQSNQNAFSVINLLQ
jgi:flagellin